MIAASAGFQTRIRAALEKAAGALLAERDARGVWVGELSSSALSTATAVVALAAVDRARHADLIARGLAWLALHRNSDGGWGDTVRSKSNISTTALCWAAFGAARADEKYREAVNDAERWLARGSQAPGAPDSLLDADLLVRAIADRYGKDRTFSVPILMTLAIAGRLGENAWHRLPHLPFEFAALPHQIFGVLRMPVVSYALPALIALGQAIHHHAPARNPLARWIRGLAKDRTLRVLEIIQPPNGGFLEATPLTSFVTMALASMGLAAHPVSLKGVEFLRASVRTDGSWPVDTNLATWCTTLSVKALAHDPLIGLMSAPEKNAIREWLLAQQYRAVHPYTHAAPGGWAWTDLPGGVPDADDTAGALLALHRLGDIDARTREAAAAGVAWLVGLQNRDGGIPTFCRGWGALPFDRSSPDLTAHAIRAWLAWRDFPDEKYALRVNGAIRRAVAFLAKNQRDDGSWMALWFGNEHAPGDGNPAYGTAHVALALQDLDACGFENVPPLLARAVEWLIAAQNADGGWGGAPGCPSSVEETALAIESLAGFFPLPSSPILPADALRKAIDSGLRWLIEKVENDRWRDPAPIGFYFAKLWYFERLYPLIFTVSALGKVSNGLA